MEKYEIENEEEQQQEQQESYQGAEKPPVKIRKPKAPKVQIVKSEIKPNGETIQLVRPLAATKETSDDIVHRLINQYGTRPMWDQTELSDFNMVKTAFPNVAGQILNAYEGAQLVTDQKQDLVGERYLTEQIKMINEENKKKSILDKWSHLLYEGEDERTYQTAAAAPSPFYDASAYKPLNSQTFTLNGQFPF